MLEYLLYDLLIFNETDKTHLSLALWTGERIRFIDLLDQSADQSGQVLSVFFG